MNNYLEKKKKHDITRLSWNCGEFPKIRQQPQRGAFHKHGNN